MGRYGSFVFLIFLFFYLFSSCFARDFGAANIRMWQTRQWEIKKESWTKNPFDIRAQVIFTHESDRETRRTETFYDGKDSWKFRFTATRPGKWTFVTRSSDADLDGHTGTVMVEKTQAADSRGFLTHQGNRFALQAGDSSELVGYRFAVYMNGKKFPCFGGSLKDKPWWQSPLFAFKNDAHLEAYLADAKNHGFEIIFLLPGFPHVWARHSDAADGKNPRIETFEVLEKAITEAHSRGMRVHLWMWGDAQRGATPKAFDSSLTNRFYSWTRSLFSGSPDVAGSGINGKTDRRLQRYIAARLGPLPGWSMGYGFDLHEWVDEQEVNDWAAYLHEKFGWDHLLSARGFVLKGQNNINAYDGFGRDVPLATSNYGPKDYDEIVTHMESNTSQPHLYAERHTYKRQDFGMDMDGTRRLLWKQAMAGGMGGWYGFYENSAYPYPNPEQLQTVHRFWRERFLLDMQRDNAMTNGYALKTPDNRQLVLYRQDADSVFVDLSAFDGRLSAVAVDAGKAYKELPLETLKREKQMIALPYKSDWAVAVGEFSIRTVLKKHGEFQ